jgi:hypothetical protein
MVLLDISEKWTVISSVSTIAVFIVTTLYTIITFSIFRQNKNANQLSAYLALKKDLTTDTFVFSAGYCRNNKFKIDESNTVIEECGYKLDNGEFIINFITFKREVLDHIEDLALFEEKNLLSLDLIDAGYGYSLLHIGSNDEVRKMILSLKNQGRVYNGFGSLYSKIFKTLNAKERNNYKPTLF